MRRTCRFVSVIGVFFAVAGVAGAAGPSADYRFEGNFRSSTGVARNLDPVGPLRACPPCAEFDKEKFHGERQGVWKWPEEDGLRLTKADKVLGHGGRTYTFSFLVNLDTVDGYRKLVDFDDREADEGWYVDDESLHPYSLKDFEKKRIQAGRWHQIVLTRDGEGFVRGYVDGALLGRAKDRDKDLALGPQDTLHFLMDDGGSEQSGGMIARLRIWENALDNRQVRRLGD